MNNGHATKQQLTFTAPPSVQRAKVLPRVDYTFTPERLDEIKHQNNHLLLKLVEINNRSLPQNQKKTQRKPKKLPCMVAPAAINRKLQNQRIQQENMEIYERLQAVKPSKDLAIKTMLKHSDKQSAYQKICSKFHPQQDFQF
eukprot:TRINITY_DN16558_c0_g1_i1.p3 TRINITY_DN16558_c0_g1~~TRINITY_DN16558_c0_g1_i1.p3  ORF type:complete len:142 (-),score=10.29 TRINITY_DN16558_c0_g1_i1:301-726(-)